MVFTLIPVHAQNRNIIESEDKVPYYVLPDPLVSLDGTRIHSSQQWLNVRKPEIIRLFEKEVYGKAPTSILPGITFEIINEDRNALKGKAVRKEVLMKLSDKHPELNMVILIYLPVGRVEPVPVFLATNSLGNQEVHSDPAISLTSKWVTEAPSYGIINNKVTEAGRGAGASRWQVERLIERGYGLATFYCGDLDLDTDDQFKTGIHKLFYKTGQIVPEPDEWGTLAVWSWGLSRCMDYFEKDKDIDEKRITVFGHSRTGKAALWAGATDTRFAAVISNNSGCGGAAISRRRFGETVEHINRVFPFWFCGNFKKYNNNEDELPVDQHMLISLIAPRPIYIASAEEDLWADPKGEFLSAKLATPVYHLFGLKGMEVETQPPIHRPVFNYLGYHIRAGGHDITPYDWEQFMNFADYHFFQH